MCWQDGLELSSAMAVDEGAVEGEAVGWRSAETEDGQVRPLAHVEDTREERTPCPHLREWQWVVTGSGLTSRGVPRQVYYYDGLGNTTWDRPDELKGEDGEEEDAAADEEVGMAVILTSKGKVG